ncbi:MAG: chemotaxis-specific protein-glutamate methyltransferase CheB [Chloroflexi bacterium]|nr:chemotaxis-specific protein-glutamate methyltransferase CheB [Chloroflexota bacterium]
MTAEQIRVLVVDDSASARELLVRLLVAEGSFEVVGTARDGEQAVALAARLRPNVITMDVHMPRLDGVAATRRIMAETPTPIVVVSASINRTAVDLAFAALQAGALAVADKPPGPGDPRHAAAARELLSTVRLMAEVKVVRRWATGRVDGPAPSAPKAPGERSLPRRAPLRAILLAASTGGPQAIQTVLQSLGSDVGVPILAVQHMAPGFMPGMADWLASTCPQRVHLATHGDQPVGNTVYLAPDGYHLLVTRSGRLGLSKAPPLRGFRPSASVLFESAAECYGATAAGVILTGMGDDGVAGLAALRASGGVTIAQDEATSVVYGMPRAALAAGAVGHVLPLGAIGPALRSLLALDESPAAAT